MNKDSTPEETHRQYQKENHFKVPEGYFENLPNEISRKIEAYQVVPLHKSSTVRRITFVSSLAAAVIVITLVFSFLIQKETTTNNEFSFIDISDQAITEYLADNIDENTLVEATDDDISFFDAGKLNELITADDSIVRNKVNSSIEMDTTLKKEDILEYLLQENIDPETL